MSKDDKAIFYHKPQTFQWTPADGVFSFGENRKEQNMIRYYSVPKETFVTNGTIVEPLNVTENGTYAPPAGTAYSPVVVNVEGGGGSSDFSTATLTLTRGAGARGTLYVSNLAASPMGTSLFPMLNYIEGTNTYEVVIYSGGTLLSYEGTDTVTIDGNIQDVGGGSYLITGDCTITIS